MSALETAVPDLLRRFVPTPYRLHTAIRNTMLELQTNDLEIISALQQAARTPNADCAGPLLMKVIRDHDVTSDGNEPLALTAWPVATLMVGTNTVLALDRERREVLGFLAASISANRFVEELLPLLFDLLRRPRLRDRRT
jgi:hypothetical protein